ncbi:MAG: hypothetical protein ACREJ3_18465, partial [Polyangiaceae bacterium]
PVSGSVTPSVIDEQRPMPTKLPPVPAMTNVVAVPDDDSASITFDPVDGAADYRVYELPSDADIAVAPDGTVAIHNAIYRCAGDREAPVPQIDDGPRTQSTYAQTMVIHAEVGGYTRSKAEATLGYVYTTAGAGRAAAYALGDSDPNADDSCYFGRWAESRVKEYTTSERERAARLAARWRDDGIVFYVPAVPSSATRIIESDTDHGTRFYFPEGPEASHHPRRKAAFIVLSKPEAGSVPLMRVFYKIGCGSSHDELLAGRARFLRAYKQGDTQPVFSLLWTGLTRKTTLVVEALDAGCPFQGHLSPKSIPSTAGHQPYVTIDDVRAASPTGEVFINGQHEPGNRPRAIARSFITVSPKPHAPMDFFAGFSPEAKPETFATIPCGSPDGSCFHTWRQQSKTFDAMFMTVETGLWAMGPVLGELWVTYADWASDVNGKFRLTPVQKARMSASAFLHVTMEVDTVTTGRRYPQILISDQDAPVQYTLEKGNTLIAQTFGDWPNLYQLEVCNHRTWDVNNQCPAYDLYHLRNASGDIVNLAPNDEVGEHASVDHRVTFDVYASTRRAYLFLDGKPYGCADLPAAGVPSGPVTVTFGDVLYHSGVDHTFAFHKAHMQTETRRHFDNLGFSSGVPAPSWDESRLPCVAPITP